MNWTIVDGLPIWQQLAAQLTQAIATGDYPLGGRVPPVRELALEAGVNPNTMQRALAQLEADGLVVTNRTAGRTVTDCVETRTTLRKRLASDAIHSYLNQMYTLGFTPQEATTLLTEMEDEQ